MKKQSIAGILLAGLLSACGGGGGGQSATQPSVTAPVSYTAAKLALNDFQSYQLTWQSSITDGKSSSSKYGYTKVAALANKDGSSAQASVYDDYYARIYAYYNADGGLTGEGGTCQHVYTPAYIEIPATLSVGKTWESSLVSSCSDNETPGTPISLKGSAVSIETVTVPAGTFSAIKTVTSSTSLFKTSSAVQNSTCWRDTVTGYELKCEKTNTYTRNETGAVSRKETFLYELAGYSHAATGKKQLNVERFGGKWQIWYSGEQTGICSVNIDKTGVVKGDCHDSQYSGFSIVGTVDAEGVGKFSVSSVSDATMFSGNFESPLKISGSWNFQGRSGTWYMLHL